MSLAHLMLGKCEPEMFATATPAIPATQAGDAGRGVASRVSQLSLSLEYHKSRSAGVAILRAVEDMRG